MNKGIKFLNSVCLCIISCTLFLACGAQPLSNNAVNLLQTKDSIAKKLSIVQKLKENDQSSIEEKIALYYTLKKNNFDTYNFANETELTLYGYSFLWGNQLSEAIAIFKLIIDEFPGSANAYDSMGEAYLQAKDSVKALQNYEKSLQLNPDNFFAEDVIDQIKNPTNKPLTAKEKFTKVYTKQDYLADIDQLGQKLLSIHPQALKFITKEQFLKNIEEIKLLINEKTTYAEFAWHCNAIIASVGCSHTASSNMQNAYHELSIVPLEKTFPLAVRLINDQLFVVNPMNNADKVKVKDEILSINGVEISKLISSIYKHISAQAHSETYKRQKFNTYFALMIPYALGFPASFEVNCKGRLNTIKLKQSNEFARELYDPSENACADQLCLQKVDDNTAVLTISSFNYYEWDSYPVFKAFVDSSMKVIHQSKIKNLIIDVRYNGGGSQYPSIYLLQHLMDKPFTYYSKVASEDKKEKSFGEDVFYPNENRFKGKVYFLIDGKGNSTTGHFVSLVKANQLGTIIGEDLGSNHFCTAGQTLCRLKNTKVVISIANNTHISTATNLPDEKGIAPDIYVTQTIDEYLKREDVVKNYALELVKK
jgi:C-terminal processing protease CtpA/Prc